MKLIIMEEKLFAQLTIKPFMFDTIYSNLKIEKLRLIIIYTCNFITLILDILDI